MMKIRKSQWLRHTVQLLVLLFLFLAPLLSWYGNRLARGQVDDMRQANSPKLQHHVLRTVDDFFRSGKAVDIPNQHTHTRSILDKLANLRGNTWSAEIGGVSIGDPLGATESIVAGKALFRRILPSLLIPVVVTLILGRVFCSWICPAGTIFETNETLRAWLERLGVRTRNVTFRPALKWVVLGVGLLMSFLLSLPLLSYIYPPATVAREVHGGVIGWLNDIDPTLSVGSWIVVTAGTLFLFGILLIELFVSKRFWCRYVCPGGSIYSLLGVVRLVRVARDPATCNNCADCIKVCPMGLVPMKDKFGIACDTCLACVSVCPERALDLKLKLPKMPATAESQAQKSA